MKRSTGSHDTQFKLIKQYTSHIYDTTSLSFISTFIRTVAPLSDENASELIIQLIVG